MHIALKQFKTLVASSNLFLINKQTAMLLRKATTYKNQLQLPYRKWLLPYLLITNFSTLQKNTSYILSVLTRVGIICLPQSQQSTSIFPTHQQPAEHTHTHSKRKRKNVNTTIFLAQTLLHPSLLSCIAQDRHWLFFTNTPFTVVTSAVKQSDTQQPPFPWQNRKIFPRGGLKLFFVTDGYWFFFHDV